MCYGVIPIFQIQLEIVLLIAVGYFLTKKGVFGAKARTDLTNIVIYVILPCNIFLSFSKGVTMDVLRQCVIVFLAALGAQLLYIVLNKVLYRQFPPERQVIMKYATICNNAGFMGLPVIESVFGATGLLYGAVVLIPIRIFMWTAGLSLFTKTDTRSKVRALATHPCIWAVILGFIYMFVPVELPVFLLGTLSALGTCTTALSMIVVGSILSEVELKSVLDKDGFYFSFFRLIAIPAVIYGVMRLVGADSLATGAVVLSSAMPAATLTAILAEKYGGDAAFASKMLFISTVLSLVTLPIWAEIIV